MLMDYMLVKEHALSAPVLGVWGSGTIEYWLVIVKVNTIQKYVINAMSAFQALQITEEIMCSPVCGYSTLPDGNIKVSYLSNQCDFYLFTGF